jgi:hypothetical protein
VTRRPRETVHVYRGPDVCDRDRFLRRVCAAKRPSVQVKLFLSVLAAKYMDDDARVSVKRSELARLFDVDEKTVQRWYGHAVAAGLLVSVSRGMPGSAAVYRGVWQVPEAVLAPAERGTRSGADVSHDRPAESGTRSGADVSLIPEPANPESGTPTGADVSRNNGSSTVRPIPVHSPDFGPNVGHAHAQIGPPVVSGPKVRPTSHLGSGEAQAEFSKGETQPLQTPAAGLVDNGASGAVNVSDDKPHQQAESPTGPIAAPVTEPRREAAGTVEPFVTQLTTGGRPSAQCSDPGCSTFLLRADKPSGLCSIHRARATRPTRAPEPLAEPARPSACPVPVDGADGAQRPCGVPLTGKRAAAAGLCEAHRLELKQGAA